MRRNLKFRIQNSEYMLFFEKAKRIEKFVSSRLRPLTGSGLRSNNKILKSPKGFTIIEVLVVVSVFSVVGVIIGGIFFGALRGTKKTNTITLIRQNGNYAISQMSKMIRFADTLDAPACPGEPAPAMPHTIEPPVITITSSLDDQKTTFTCDVANNMLASNSASLLNVSTDTNPNTVILDKCQFTCSRNQGGPPTIGIDFTLKDKNSGNIVESKASVRFQTSVTMRNY
jgi:prepilin-type N-terminal cleavage/methylation domain-containing protein